MRDGEQKKQSLEQMKCRIAEAGYKLTKPRVEVLRFLCEARTPSSAREIAEGIPGIDTVSVYRAVTLFSDLRIVHADVLGREMRYCVADRPHHHIVCRVCGETAYMKCVYEFPRTYKGYRDIEHQLSLSGICKSCRSKKG